MVESDSPSVSIRSRWRLIMLGAGLAALLALALVAVLRGKTAPMRASPLEARMELAAGEVTLEQQGTRTRAASGTAVLAGAKVTAGKGARALLRLSDGSALFLRGGTSIALGADGTALEMGEAWLEVPAVDRKPGTVSLGECTISAAESGLSISRNATESIVYVARGLAHVNAPGGRVEVHAGERAVMKAGAAPVVTPVAYWEDWTGGMADQRLAVRPARVGSTAWTSAAPAARRAPWRLPARRCAPPSGPGWPRPRWTRPFSIPASAKWKAGTG
jgi:hypothetical protein